MTYQEGDRIKVKSTGKFGIVTAGSFPVTRSVADAKAVGTHAVLAKLEDGDEFERELIHEEIEKAEEKKGKHEYVQPEPEHRGKPAAHKR